MGCCNKKQSKHEGKASMEAANLANGELLDTIQFLRSTPMFHAALQQQEYPKVAAACKRKCFSQGEKLVSVGDDGAEFFVIRSGKATMWCQPPVGGTSTSRSALNTPSSGSTSPVKSDVRLPSKEVSKEGVISEGNNSLPTKSKSVTFSQQDFVSEQEPEELEASEGDRPADAEFVKLNMPPDLDRGRSWLVTATATGYTTESSYMDGLLKMMFLFPKDYFGERSLLFGEASDVTVVAESDNLECIVLSQDAFSKLGLLQKLRMPRRRPLRLPNFFTRGRTSRLVEPRTEEEMAAITAALESSEQLSEILDPDRLLLRALAERTKKRVLGPDEVLVSPETTELCLYVVFSGALTIVRLQDSERQEREKSLSMASRRMTTIAFDDSMEGDSYLVEAGSCYGEQALIYEVPLTATVKASGRTIVYAINMAALAEANRFVAEQRAEQNTALLDNVEIFSTLLNHEKALIGKALVEVDLERGYKITLEGEVADGLCILIDGEVSVVEDGIEKEPLSAGQGDVEYFGEEALRKPMACESPATVTVTSERAKCLILSTAAVDSEAHQRVLNNAGMGSASTNSWGYRPSNSSTTSDLSVQSMASLASDEGGGREQNGKKKKLKLEDMKAVAVLGKGSFGLVQLVEHTKTTELFALKKMKKAKLISSEVLKIQTMNEKNILQMTDSSFIIKLYKTFKTETELIFVLEPALGGELYTVFWNEKLFGKPLYTQFYSASLVCALTHLHERYIIYRDLKPENVLLDAQGRLKLADMGLAKFIIGKTYTVCGTPCYLAPEAARQIGYTVAVDWWALGIVVWELLTGKTPFDAQYRGEVMHWLFTRKVLADLSSPDREWPRVFTEPAKDFLRAVLAYDPAKRVPMLPDGQSLFRANSWFSGLDWDALETGALPPPYQPKIDRKKLSEVKNFRNDVTDEFDNEEFEDDGTGWDKDF